MKRSVKQLAVVVALLLTGLLFARFARMTPGGVETKDDHFKTKVNLALRRTAHYLLAENGDTTSRIAPVQDMGAGIYLLQLERQFDYGRLPALLQESFQLHDIPDDYDVAVLDCADSTLQLGYNVMDVRTGKGIPCGGRAQGSGCYNIQVIFTPPADASKKSMGWWMLASGFLLGGFCYGAWSWLARRPGAPAPSPEQAVETDGLSFGHSSLDLANQLLLVGSVRHQLTYREAKLLHLFVSHLGQLLERDFILQSVWQDEGIIVGRSVDVFVSRLRKMLRDDPTLRIVTVHGMGYRLEAKASE